MNSQTQEFRKAIRLIFVDPVTYVHAHVILFWSTKAIVLTFLFVNLSEIKDDPSSSSAVKGCGKT